MISEAIDFRFLLLENYKKLNEKRMKMQQKIVIIEIVIQIALVINNHKMIIIKIITNTKKTKKLKKKLRLWALMPRHISATLLISKRLARQ